MLTKVPLLYSILLANSLALAYTHYGVAPDYLTIYMAAFLSIACISRAVMWYRYKYRTFSLAQANHQIKMTVIFSVIMGVTFSAWSYTLYSYGDFAHQAHVIYYMSITVIGIIVCLIHLPQAAWAISITTGIPFVSFSLFSGQPVFVAIASNFTLVIAVLVMVAMSYYRAFSRVINAKQELEYQHQETQKLNIQNELLANQDGLTKLANRRSFSNYLEEKLTSFSPDNKFIVGIIDLDGFKPVNDIHGHAAGDRVLTDVSSRLQRLLGEDCMLARIGGDEFALIIDHSSNPEAVQDLGQNITRVIQRPFAMRTGVVQISGSCGFAIYPDAGNTTEQLMDRADFALYEAKKKTRGSSVIFNSDHEHLIMQKSQVELALTHSIKKEQISLHYQPIVHGATGKIIGLEALARWYHPELGQIPPEQFVTIAEKTGRVTDITLYLFEKAVNDLKAWPEPLFLSFNLSAQDVMNSNTLELLNNILQQHQVSPKRVQYEITETTMMADLDLCSNTTQRLQQQGFKIALDDFGSGYSSLGYIHKLAFDNLKIDRSFVHNLQQSQRSQGVVKTIVELCSSFAVSCTVEGVETEEQKDLLLALGCNQMQGYYFYSPAPIEEFDLHKGL
ncbi:EAL domain-containing protein [Alteromonadaceae bacterium BrNp21-10]|nr:EAL domain-containing protein [Alteromonadaceae bacterium BrNp21-10]